MKATRTRSVFVCQQCGAQAPKWHGRCHECGEWNTLVEELASPQKGMALNIEGGARPLSLREVEVSLDDRYTSGIGELDRVLGGGIVAGSMVLLGGPPGIGKSTLLLQMAGHLAKSRPPILYVSGEESPRQIRMRAERLNALHNDILILAETRLEAIEQHIRATRPGLVMVDSVQTLFRSDLAPAPGSVTQVRECAASLMRLAKQEGMPILLVGHVTKDGNLAGPRVLEHLVDTVLYFEGDGLHNVRALRSVKNRFGSTQEVGLFRMSGRGLDPIPDASAFLLSQRERGGTGSIVFPSLEGTRTLLVELQALVSKNRAAESGAPPARRVVGLDGNRLSLLLAVMSRKIHPWACGRHDVYANVAGGLRLTEPALDLPLVLALASSRADAALDPGLAAVGEIGLGGEIRSVAQIELRLKELQKLGFTRCIIPRGNLEGVPKPKIEVIQVRLLQEAVAAANIPTPDTPQTRKSPLQRVPF